MVGTMVVAVVHPWTEVVNSVVVLGVKTDVGRGLQCRESRNDRRRFARRRRAGPQSHLSKVMRRVNYDAE